jgi:putative thioredoxin
MGISIDVNQSAFLTDVIEASYQQPVLLDFFAQWCGPCQMLKPILEKLVQEYDFVLAKVDIDQNPELANSYQVEGVPDVRVVSQGEVFPGFVGVLPEPKIRELLNQFNLQSGLETGLEEARSAVAAGDLEKAKAVFARLIEQYPQSRALAIEAAKFLILQDKLGSAEKLLAFIEEHERDHYAQADALRNLIQLKLESQNPPQHDFDPTFFEAVQQTIVGEYETALQNLLAIVAKDRKYRNDGARKAMLMVFSLLGDTHPLTMHYRKQLTQTLY